MSSARRSSHPAFARLFVARGRTRCRVLHEQVPLTVALPVVSSADRVLLTRAVVALMEIMVAAPGGPRPARILEAANVASQLKQGETAVRVPATLAGALCACLHDLTGR